MKLILDLTNSEFSIEHSDGSLEKIEHCRVHPEVKGMLLRVEVAAVIHGETLVEVEKTVNVPRTTRSLIGEEK